MSCILSLCLLIRDEWTSVMVSPQRHICGDTSWYTSFLCSYLWVCCWAGQNNFFLHLLFHTFLCRHIIKAQFRVTRLEEHLPLPNSQAEVAFLTSFLHLQSAKMPDFSPVKRNLFQSLEVLMVWFTGKHLISDDLRSFLGRFHCVLTCEQIKTLWMLIFSVLKQPPRSTLCP